MKLYRFRFHRLNLLHLMIFSSSNEYRTNKVRTHSAKGAPRVQRPNSRNLTRTSQKSDFIEGVKFNNDQSPNKHRKLSVNKQQQKLQQYLQKRNTRYLPIQNTTKSKEQLFDENMKLKKEINKITEQLAILKSRAENKTKEMSERNKRLNIEFQKPLYYSGNNSHMIAGIKFQYEKLQKENEQMKKEINSLKIELFETKRPEYQIYIQRILIENKRLSQKLEKLQRIDTEVKNRSEQMAMQYQLYESEQNEKNLKLKIEEYEKEMERKEENEMRNQQKLEFMEKLIIEKDNREYHMGIKAKKMEKLKNRAQEKCDQLMEENGKMKKKYEAKTEEINSNWKKRLEEQEKYFMDELEMKDRKIRLLEEQYHKLEEVHSKMKMEISTGFQEFTAKNGTLEMSKSMGRKVSIDLNNIIKFNSAFSNQEQEDQNEEVEREREMQRADKKHCDNSVKNRKVRHSEIEEIGELIKYRLIGEKLDQKNLRNFFCKRNADNNSQWESTYITMSQTIQILKSRPFNLNQTSAELLARYMIEDCEEDYVYTDLNNENKRDIVKSIIKNFVGDYSISQGKDLEQCEDFLEKYGSNAHSSLSSYFPHGKVGKRKFLDCISSLGANLSDQVKDQLLGRACLVSEDLDQLEYGKIFKQA